MNKEDESLIYKAWKLAERDVARYAARVSHQAVSPEVLEQLDALQAAARIASIPKPAKVEDYQETEWDLL